MTTYREIRRRSARLARRAALALLPLALAPAATRAQEGNPVPPPTVARLGSCRLASGTTIADCRVAYRAYGALNAARDNAVLVPTFFAGRSEDHAFMLGAYVDTTRYHVLIVDALADGHSSSPSNTRGGAAAFAGLTIGDMVETQRRLLVEHLGITRLHAVVGISMGAFQAYEIAVRHPALAERVVAVLGSPRPAPFDRLVYSAILSEAERGQRSADADAVWTQLSRIEALAMRTPRAVNDGGWEVASREVETVARTYRSGWALADYAAQMSAIRRQDVSARFGGELARAARAVTARMLVVTSDDDQMVSAGPALEFARHAGAETLRVSSACGHALFWCESASVGAAVRRFVDADGGRLARAAGR